MFGIGLAEFAVIAFFGLVLFGPDKLPDLARQAAKALRTARSMANTVRDDLRENLGEDYADLELRDLHPRELVRRQVREVMDAEDADTADDDTDDDNDDNDTEMEVEDAPRPRLLNEGKSA